MKISDLTKTKIDKLRRMPSIDYDDNGSLPQKELTTYEMGRNAAGIGLSSTEALNLIKNSPRFKIPGEYEKFIDGYKSFKSVDK